jgi:hypothetical protein
MAYIAKGDWDDAFRNWSSIMAHRQPENSENTVILASLLVLDRYKAGYQRLCASVSERSEQANSSANT